MDSVRSVLRAAGTAAFVVAVLLLLVNAPSLSGAAGLAAIVAGAVAFVLALAWVTVALIGREGPSESEFERIVRRSEALAREPVSARVPFAGAAEPSDFDLLVADAIDRLPAELVPLLETTPVIVSSHGREYHAYGHYFGGNATRDDREHRIVLYQDTLERDFGHDPDLLRAQVERTLRHELAHHIGWDEPGVRGLGL